MRKEHFYFVAGLPDIGFEEGKLPLAPGDFLREAGTQLDAGDMGLLRLFVLPGEIGDLIGVLFGEEREPREGALVGRETWQAYVASLKSELEPAKVPPPEPYDSLPPFIAELAADCLASEEKRPRLWWEQRFTRAFYDYALGHPNGFIREWFAFDRDMRNVLAALAGRRAGAAYAEHLVGTGEEVDKLRSSQAADFGLGKQVPLVETLARIMDQADAVERERALDALRWKWIDGRNFFEYFTIDRIAGYYAQLRILDRWARLDPDAGRAVFFEALSALEASFRFPEDFSLKPRRRGHDETGRELR